MIYISCDFLVQMYSLKRVLRSSWFAVITTQVSVTVFAKLNEKSFESGQAVLRRKKFELSSPGEEKNG